jgi:predicted ATPase
MTAEAIESQQKTEADAQPNSITRIAVAGFKSIAEEREIEIRPLTILAGANSSGKSSIMQPLLLLKQTIEAPFDPGALLINGPILSFHLLDQLFAKSSSSNKLSFKVGYYAIRFQQNATIVFERVNKTKIAIEEVIYANDDKVVTLRQNSSKQDLLKLFPESFLDFFYNRGDEYGFDEVEVVRNRSFLELSISSSASGKRSAKTSLGIFEPDALQSVIGILNSEMLQIILQKTMYLPGLRGNPERVYPITAVGETFPGQFQNYTASVILKWQQEQSPNLEKLAEQLAKLKLAEMVQARQLNDAQIEILVNRRGNGRSKKPDMVSIADVGVGVSQTLPVLVALLVAKPGQLVYIEQPEIHLHPRAQVALAEILADAARRGVKVVIETHSDLLLLSIQTLVAEGKLPPELVKLHWFELNKKGITEITSRDLDFAGRFGDWPEDFAEVKIQADSAYLDAAEASLRAANRAAKKS